MNEEKTSDIYRLRMQDLYQDVNMVKKKVYLMCSISRLTFHKVLALSFKNLAGSKRDYAIWLMLSQGCGKKYLRLSKYCHNFKLFSSVLI